MMPRPHSMDAHTRAQELASSVLSSSSPPAIASAISAADSIIRKLTADQSRAFFSIAFPAIICRLFGFDDSSSNSARSAATSTAWIDQVYQDPDLASRLFALLSPQGPLFSAISSADHHGLVKYIFPAERLPEWMRYALQSERHFPILAEICPLFRGRVKEDTVQGSFQLQLNAFEYYMFWFAYYPVCKGNSEGSDGGLIQKSRRKSRLVNWTSSLPTLINSSRRSGQKIEASLYLRLLYAYLHAFAPKCGLGSHQPYRSSLLHYSSSCDISVFNQSEFLIYTLIHFWLVDNDFSPLPLSVCQSFGISFPHRVVLGETPPTPGLGEAVKLLVSYLNLCLVAFTEGSNQKVLESFGTISVRPVLSFENTVSSWNLAVQRPLYRFILRTFLFCPIGVSMNNVTQVLSAWVTYLVPWRTHPDDFVVFEPPTGRKSESSKTELVQGKGAGDSRSRPEAMYTPLWEGYVAANYLFYSSLVVHFIGFSHKFLHANVEAVVDMVLKVLNILTSSKELMDLLRNVDIAYHSKQSGLYTSSSSVDKYIPSIRQQLKDWEHGLCESDTDGSFLHDNWNQNLKLFKNGEDGALKLLQLFVLRAEHEIQSTSGDGLRNLQALDSIKIQMNTLFGCTSTPSSHSPNPASERQAFHHSREVFTPKHPGFGSCTWADVKYKGDWMHRPVSDTEVAWLARLLIRVSDWLNEAFGLDLIDNSGPCQPVYVDLAPGNWTFDGVSPKEAALLLLNIIVSWVGLFGHSVLSFMRGQRMRINLRVFSSKKFFMFSVVFAALYALKKACSEPAVSSLAYEVKLMKQ